MGVDEFEFIQTYTRLRPQRDGLALKDKNNGECIFLEGKGLAVENKMVADYIEGKLDSKNAKVISMCELRVVEDTVKIN
jgi:hypothetical protein